MEILRDLRQKRGQGVSFREVLRVAEFRALWIADAQSQVGDFLARVALSVLVFDATGSTALTALAYAITFLPEFLGGALLGGIADRYSWRTVMIWCDVFRAAVLAVMAVDQVPISAVIPLVVAAVFVGPLFSAARIAILPQILEGEKFVVGQGLRAVTGQLSQLVGFAAGGVAVAVIGARPALAVDAGTYALSALLVWRYVRPRPVPEEAQRHQPYFQSLRDGVRQIVRSPALRTLLGFGWLAALYIAPEGLAAPYASQRGGGPVAVGLLLAAMPVGTAVGAWLLVRFVAPGARERMIGPLAVAAAVVLIACAPGPGLVLSWFLWFGCGLFCAYQVPAAAAFVQRIPDARRGSAFGVAASGVIAVQGVGVLVFGWIGARLGAAPAIGIAGGVACVIALALWAVSARPTARIATDSAIGRPANLSRTGQS